MRCRYCARVRSSASFLSALADDATAIFTVPSMARSEAVAPRCFAILEVTSTKKFSVSSASCRPMKRAMVVWSGVRPPVSHHAPTSRCANASVCRSELCCKTAAYIISPSTRRGCSGGRPPGSYPASNAERSNSSINSPSRSTQPSRPSFKYCFSGLLPTNSPSRSPCSNSTRVGAAATGFATGSSSSSEPCRCSGSRCVFVDRRDCFTRTQDHERVRVVNDSRLDQQPPKGRGKRDSWYPAPP